MQHKLAENTLFGEHASPQFKMPDADIQRLQGLPWHAQLSDWPELGVIPLTIRRGESRHPVIFVERDGVRYAIKETSPHMAEREIHSLEEIERRGIPVLASVGSVTVHAPPIRLEALVPGGVPQYMSGDRGYTVTRLARRVIPHALLFRLPLTRRTKQRLLSAIAVLLVELHEHGIYWGDPSLANVLIRIDDRRVLAIMADAETAELFQGPVEEGLRQQDLEHFHESLIWQTEDLRIARGIVEDDKKASSTLLGEKDYRYFERRYRWLRKEHAQMSKTLLLNLFQVERMMNTLNRLGYSLLSFSNRGLQALISVAPGWYERRIHELLGIKVPPRYSRRFYNTILGHQCLLSEKQGRDVSIEEAARDWYSRYHLPTMLLLRQILTSDQDPMQAYFAILDTKWHMSVKAGYEVPLDEALLDWAMRRAELGNLGPVDPAAVASWHQSFAPAIQALEPPVIESGKLAPLLTEEQQPLVRANDGPLNNPIGLVTEEDAPVLHEAVEEEKQEDNAHFTLTEEA